MRNILFILPLLIIVNLSSCQSSDPRPQDRALADGTLKAVVEDVLQANSYTYLNVREGEKMNWLAVTKREIEKGTTVYYKPELEMKDFKSKDLDRTFAKIYFVSNISTSPIPATVSKAMPAMGGAKKENLKADVSVEQPQGGVSISKISTNRAAYEGKTILVRGQVTKYNPNIMKRNWVHIQDGTKDGSTYDLTITTNDAVKKGDVVTFKGKIVLNKDFGAGYKYDIIMEEARLQ